MTTRLPLPPLPRLTPLSPERLHRQLWERLGRWRVPDFRVPPALASLLARLPPQPPTQALIVALNFALDRILPRDVLAPLQGRHLVLCVSDAGLRFDFSLGERGFVRHRAGAQARPDLVIAATTRDFIALALREEDPDTLFFSRRLRLEGNTELGLLVKNTLDAIDWDSLRARFAPVS